MAYPSPPGKLEEGLTLESVSPTHLHHHERGRGKDRRLLRMLGQLLGRTDVGQTLGCTTISGSQTPLRS